MSKVSATMPLVRGPCRTRWLGAAGFDVGDGDGVGFGVGRGVGFGVGRGVGACVGGGDGRALGRALGVGEIAGVFVGRAVDSAVAVGHGPALAVTEGIALGGAGLAVGVRGVGEHGAVGAAVGAITPLGEINVPNAAPASANRRMSAPIPWG
jgi:hypothetical protein